MPFAPPVDPVPGDSPLTKRQSVSVHVAEVSMVYLPKPMAATSEKIRKNLIVFVGYVQRRRVIRGPIVDLILLPWLFVDSRHFDSYDDQKQIVASP